MFGGFVGAAVLFVVVFGWFALPRFFGMTDYLGRPSTGADRNTAATKVGPAVPAQREPGRGQAKRDPAGSEDATGGRARQIRQSSQPVSLSEDQRNKLSEIFSNSRGPHVDRP